MMPLDYLRLLELLAPEVIVAITALCVLTFDLTLLRNESISRRFHLATAFGAVGCLTAAIWAVTAPQNGDFLNGMLVLDPLTRWVKAGVLVLTIFTLLVAAGSTFTRHVGEYVATVLFATLGMLFLAGTEELLMLFLALELTSLSLYILVAFDKNARSGSEAALKYFLFGGASAAFMLYGLSLIYGATGSTNLGLIAVGIAEQADPLVLVGMVMTTIGFGFKIAAVPFHFWAPDAYQGAPIPSAALVASGSKLASFFVMAKVFTVGFGGLMGSGAWGAFDAGWIALFALLSLLSMVFGNLAALAQSSVRRLLAYSAIAHAGYFLLGVLAATPSGLIALIYYGVVYGLATIGAFAVTWMVERETGSDRISDFAGLSARSPGMAFCLMIFLLSLAGVPPLAGFAGKFFLFVAAADGGGTGGGLLWLIVVAIVFSALSLYYYLKVLKQAYVVDADPTREGSGEPVSFTGKLVIGLIAAGVLVLGIDPDILMAPLKTASFLVGVEVDAGIGI